VERVVSRAEPLVRGADLVAAIQSELPIPTSTLELRPAGLLGICLNIITIVNNAEEDPIECILTVFNKDGIEFICFPGQYERESKRLTEKEGTVDDFFVHRFQVRVPNPPSKQVQALALLK
jgi:hypothetical protein